MVNCLLTSQNCLITGLILDHDLGSVAQNYLQVGKRQTLNRMVIGLFPSQTQSSGMTFPWRSDSLQTQMPFELRHTYINKPTN